MRYENDANVYNVNRTEKYAINSLFAAPCLKVLDKYYFDPFTYELVLLGCVYLKCSYKVNRSNGLNGLKVVQSIVNAYNLVILIIQKFYDSYQAYIILIMSYIFYMISA